MFSKRKRKLKPPQPPLSEPQELGDIHHHETLDVIISFHPESEHQNRKEPSSLGLDHLPMEIILHLCTYLRKPYIRRLNLVCRRLYRMTLSALYRGETESCSRESVFGWAGDRGIAGTVDLLVEFGFNVHECSEKPPHCIGGSPLEIAAELSQPDIAQILISHGADVNSTVGRATPLITALLRYPLPMLGYEPEVTHSGFETIQLLLDNGADPDQSIADTWLCTPLAAAIGQSKDIGLVNLLLDYGADVNSWEDPPLYRAIFCHNGEEQDMQIIYRLLEQGADPNAKGRMEGCHKHPTPLARAVFECQSWIESNPDPDDASKPELTSAPLQIIDLLLSYGADLNYTPVMDRENIIHRAIHPRQRIEVLRHLLDRGADPNIANLSLVKRYGIWTALHKAMWKKVPANRAALLLQYGASPLPVAPVDASTLHCNKNNRALQPSSTSSKTPATVIHPLAMNPLPGSYTPGMMYYPRNTYPHTRNNNQSTGSEYFLNGETPLHQLIRNHISPITQLATGGWKPRRDWAKFELLLSYSGSPSDVLSPLSQPQLATLLSLSVSASRNENQLRRHLVNFARLTWLRLKDLLVLCYEKEFKGIWTPEVSMMNARGRVVNGRGAAEGMEELKDRRRDQMFYAKGLSKATRAKEVLKEMCRATRDKKRIAVQ